MSVKNFSKRFLLLVHFMWYVLLYQTFCYSQIFQEIVSYSYYSQISTLVYISALSYYTLNELV
jgi:hypothetical protein